MAKKKNKKKDKKKRNKKKNKKSYYGYHKKGKGKKNKKKNTKLTLNKKDLKRRNKEIEKASVLPLVEETKQQCNHVKPKKYMTVEEARDHFDEKYNLAAKAMLMVPINAYVELFGEENVKVCHNCYDPIVDPRELDPEKVEQMLTLIHAMKNIAAFDQNKKKVELVNKAFDKLEKNIRPILKAYRKRAKKLVPKDERDAIESNRSGSKYQNLQS